MKKAKSIIFFGAMFIAILSVILLKPLLDLDEIWNFNTARCIANGLIPYKDISMITTPLSSFISAIFLKIFGTEMFVTRVLAAVLATVNLFLIRKILRKLNVGSVNANIATFSIMLIFLPLFCFDYNFLVVTMALIAILLEIKYEDNDSKFHQILIGLIGGFAICTKQSIGLLICGAILLNKLYYATCKEDVKDIIKQSLFRLIGISIPVIIFVIYLLITQSFMQFFDYCIMGISTFSNRISYFNFLSNGGGIIGIAVPIVLLASIVSLIIFKFKKTDKDELYLLTAYSIPVFAIIYPITDKIHFFIGSTIVFLIIAYAFDRLTKFISSRISDEVEKYINEFFAIIITLAVLGFTAYVELTNIDALSNLSKIRELEHFKYINVDKDLKNTIQNVDKYMCSKIGNVYIIDVNSPVYMIPINRYNKNYDMFLKGNLGSGGEDAQIENINNEDALYLVLKDNQQLNWQTPKKVIEYIKENYKKKETIELFDVYQKEK